MDCEKERSDAVNFRVWAQISSAVSMDFNAHNSQELKLGKATAS
jgi:hypothetical protein